MNDPGTQQIRVLVVEDSRSQQEVLVALLHSSAEFIVVGTASNGKQAVDAVQRLRPHVIAMAIHLPILDGYAATRQIMQQCPTPIVLISNDGDSAHRSIEALVAGALAVVHTPSGHSGAAADDERAAFLTTLRLMANVRVVTRHPARTPVIDRQLLIARQPRTSIADHLLVAGVPKVLGITASTGGPAALQTLLRGLGATFPLPILIVQHITRGFAPALVNWLNTIAPLPVRIARQNERLVPGQIYLAPDDHHLTVRAPGTIGLRPPAADDRFCPSANPLFDSIAMVYGPNAIGLVLTGMGDDGASGLLALRAAGAPTLAQDAASCVVYGMPRAAIEAGAVAHSEPLATMADVILGLVAGVVPDTKAI